MRSRGVHVFLLRSPRLAKTRKRYWPLLTIILMLLGKGALFLRIAQTSGASAPPCPEHASKVRNTSSPLDGFSSSLVSKTQIPLKIPDCCRSMGGHCHCIVLSLPGRSGSCLHGALARAIPTSHRIVFLQRLEIVRSGPLRFNYGERLRVVLMNDSMMHHPIHLHGMRGGGAALGPHHQPVVGGPSGR